jgi:hypothetical protein
VRRLKKYFVEDRVTPHPLIVVLKAQYEMLQDNSIVLSRMERSHQNRRNCTDGGITTFNILNIGKNIQASLTSDARYEEQLYNLNIRRIPGEVLLVLCSVMEQSLMGDPSIEFIPQEVSKEDYVLLLLCASNVKKIIDINKISIWDNNIDLQQLRKFKKSTVKEYKSDHHYGSSGQCYSFGLRSSFSRNMTGNITISRYAGDVATSSIDYQKYLWQIIDDVFKCFDNIIPGISAKLNMICRSMKSQSYNTELEPYFYSEIPRHFNNTKFVISGNININATTKNIHCERDVTYTTITVPQQTLEKAFIVFEFRVNNTFSLRLKCSQNSCFTYSAFCLAHRQVHSSEPTCMNISSYSGKRIFCNYRKSLQRVQNDD